MKKALMNYRLHVLKGPWKFRIAIICDFPVIYPCYFLEKYPTVLTFSIVFLYLNKTLRLNNIKTRTALTAKILVFVIFVEAIVYLLFYNLHDYPFNHGISL